MKILRLKYYPELWDRFVRGVRMDLIRYAPQNHFTSKDLESKTPEQAEELHARHLADRLRHYLMYPWTYVESRIGKKVDTWIPRKVAQKKAQLVRSIWDVLQTERDNETPLWTHLSGMVRDLDDKIREVLEHFRKDA